MMTSPYFLRARTRLRKRRIRELAPRMAPGPEARLRLAIAKLLTKFHARVRADLVSYAARRRVSARWQDTGDSRLRATFAELERKGMELLESQEFTDSIESIADETGESVREQVAIALGLSEISATLDDKTKELVDSLTQQLETRISLSLDRASDVFDEWSGLDPDTSPRAQDPEALDGMLGAGLLGILGGALASAGLLYGESWAGMNEEAQVESGTGQYIWIAQRDGFTRQAHAALDDTIADWDDPPLKAADSTNGEDDHPGEDYNCRCVAAPIPT